jgi:hypothetical protein
MPFVARFCLKSHVVPVRAYLHSAGYELWSQNGHELINARRYAQKIFKSDDFIRMAEEEKLDYVITALWNDQGKKTADVFGYSGLREEWKLTNPEVTAWNCIDGVWQSPARSCGDTMILLGEEEIRRISGTKDLAYHMAYPPPKLPSRIWAPKNER